LPVSPRFYTASRAERRIFSFTALFVSPIVDMEKLIVDMTIWADVTEDVLREKGEIWADFGETLSWEYLCWVREHPIKDWRCPTAMTSRRSLCGCATPF